LRLGHAASRPDRTRRGRRGPGLGVAAIVARCEEARGHDGSGDTTTRQINRLKMIKRLMYERAGFELLKARVLPFEPLPAC
jgi:hypothetical protein